MTLTPAYGRDYKSRAQVVTDLNEGKDFIMNTFYGDGYGGGYCSIRDLKDGQIQARDKSLRKLWTINIQDGKAK